MNSSDSKTDSLMRLGILQAGRAPEEMLATHTDYNKLFEQLLGVDEFEYKHWPVLDNVFPQSVDEADGWLITGSRYGAYEPHSWIPPLEQFIRDVYASGKPMVGVCFGHQIIAQALGGKVEKFSGGWSVGRVEYDLDPAFYGKDGEASSPTPLIAFHQDQVTQPPEGAVTVGHTDFCEHAALLYDDRILTIQPHPEFDSHFISGLLETRGEMLPADVRQNAEQTLDLPVAREPVANTLRQFLKRER